MFTPVQLEKGDKHGQGTYIFINGRKWVGEFKKEKIGMRNCTTKVKM